MRMYPVHSNSRNHPRISLASLSLSSPLRCPAKASKSGSKIMRFRCPSRQKKE